MRDLLLVFTIASSALSAQTFVVPPSNATVPGNSLEQQVFGFDQSRYAQFVDKAELAGLPTGASLKQLCYRREEQRLDKVFSSYEPMRRSQTSALPNWEIRVGNFAGDHTRLLPAYEATANQVTMTTVFAAQLNLTTHCPTLSAPPDPAFPAPFAMKFPFNIAQVMYSGAGICVNHKVYATRNVQHRYYVDSVQSSSSQGSVDLISPSTLGCPPGFNRAYGTAPNPGGGFLDLHLFGGPVQSSAVLYLGGSTTSWGSINLPLNLSFLGLPTCNIYSDLGVGLPSLTDFNGIATMRLNVPGNPSYVGLSIYAQWVLTDDRVNPAVNLGFSDGVKVTLGNRVGNPTVQMSVISAIGGQANNSFGYYRPNEGAVFQLTY